MPYFFADVLQIEWKKLDSINIKHHLRKLRNTLIPKSEVLCYRFLNFLIIDTVYEIEKQKVQYTLQVEKVIKANFTVINLEKCILYMS